METRNDQRREENDHEQIASRELVALFESLKLPLEEYLAELLEGSSKFRCGKSLETEEMGGYLEATRRLAQVIRHERAFRPDRDLELIFDFRKGAFREREEAFLLRHPEYGRIPASSLVLPHDREVLREALRGLTHHSSKLIGRMILDIIEPKDLSHLPSFPAIKEWTQIGSCKMAESFFLKAALEHIHSGCVLEDDDGNVLAWQKYGAGQPTFVTFKDIVLNGVRLPPGSLICCRPQQEATSPDNEFAFNGPLIRPRDVKDIRFLRLTTLAIPSEEREETLKSLLATQRYFNFVNAGETSLQDLEVRVSAYAHALRGK